MSTCQFCGGVIGRDCFNPQECGEITRDMASRYQHAQVAEGERRGCRRCSECRDCSHHWIPDLMADDDPEYEPGEYACKHCDVRGNACPECSGDGCTTCGGEGVLSLNHTNPRAVAVEIINHWDEWEGEAMQAAQQAQDSQVYYEEMALKLTLVLSNLITKCEIKGA